VTQSFTRNLERSEALVEFCNRQQAELDAQLTANRRRAVEARNLGVGAMAETQCERLVEITIRTMVSLERIKIREAKAILALTKEGR
jgi:hypothetical protein